MGFFDNLRDALAAEQQPHDETAAAPVVEPVAPRHVDRSARESVADPLVTGGKHARR